MAKFLLILRGDPDEWRTQTPEAIQGIIAAFEDWAGRLMAEGRFLDGKKLADGEGRVLQRRDGRTEVKDGPYGETKEILGGIHLIEADDYAHAVALCREHPEFAIGGSVEIRRLDDMAG